MGALLRALLVFLALASASTVASEEARDDRERLLCGPYKVGLCIASRVT